jgi:hypothetical protein
MYTLGRRLAEAWIAADVGIAPLQQGCNDGGRAGSGRDGKVDDEQQRKCVKRVEETCQHYEDMQLRMQAWLRDVA